MGKYMFIWNNNIAIWTLFFIVLDAPSRTNVFSVWKLNLEFMSKLEIK